jgi:hypothetical protein
MSLATLPLFAPCPRANKPQQAPLWSQAAQRDCCQKVIGVHTNGVNNPAEIADVTVRRIGLP